MSSSCDELGILNALELGEARAHLFKVCGSNEWVENMLLSRPFASVQHLLACADFVWWRLPEKEWLLAFLAHPRIGGDVEALRNKFGTVQSSNHGSGPSWEGEEQSGTKGAAEAVLQSLSTGNQEYEAKFGHVFLICATGKSADEMLAALEVRLHNTPEQELVIASGEQAKISHIRLNKLLCSFAVQSAASRL